MTGAGAGAGAVEVDAWLSAWRVFGISTAFSDRPRNLSWTNTASIGPADGDSVTLTVGDIPTHVIEGEKNLHAHSVYALGSIFGNAHGSMSLEESENYLQSVVDDSREVESEIRASFPMWLTVELKRPMRLFVDPVARFRWVRDDRVTTELLREFTAASTEYLGRVVASLLPALGDQIRIDRATLAKDQTYVVADGKATLGLPTFKTSASASVSRAGWAQLPFDAVSAALAAVPTVSSISWPLVSTPMRWLTAAMREDKDSLRRFLFAFFGLEVLANKVGPRVEKQVIADLSLELGGVPLDQFTWPSPRDSDAPWRNLAFRFAVVATHVARQEAVADTAEFRELARVRNELSHGSTTDADIENLPAWRAIDLLRRYISHVAEAGALGRL